MAGDLEGIDLPDRIAAFEEDLVLSGCGMREQLWADVYALALYLPEPLTDAEAIRNRRTSKALWLKVVYDGSVPDALPYAWHDRLRGRVPADTLRTLEALYRSVRSGDVLTLLYRDGSGTILALNGDEVAAYPDGRLVEVLLDLWIGPEPVSKNLRRLLLRGRC